MKLYVVILNNGQPYDYADFSEMVAGVFTTLQQAQEHAEKLIADRVNTYQKLIARDIYGFNKEHGNWEYRIEEHNLNQGLI